jgi:hypothetical protein
VVFACVSTLARVVSGSAGSPLFCVDVKKEERISIEKFAQTGWSSFFPTRCSRADFPRLGIDPGCAHSNDPTPQAIVNASVSADKIRKIADTVTSVTVCDIKPN